MRGATLAALILAATALAQLQWLTGSFALRYELYSVEVGGLKRRGYFLYEVEVVNSTHAVIVERSSLPGSHPRREIVRLEGCIDVNSGENIGLWLMIPPPRSIKVLGSSLMLGVEEAGDIAYRGALRSETGAVWNVSYVYDDKRLFLKRIVLKSGLTTLITVLVDAPPALAPHYPSLMPNLTLSFEVLEVSESGTNRVGLINYRVVNISGYLTIVEETAKIGGEESTITWILDSEKCYDLIGDMGYMGLWLPPPPLPSKLEVQGVTMEVHVRGDVVTLNGTYVDKYGSEWRVEAVYNYTTRLKVGERRVCGDYEYLMVPVGEAEALVRPRVSKPLSASHTLVLSVLVAALALAGWLKASESIVDISTILLAALVSANLLWGTAEGFAAVLVAALAVALVRVRRA
ncbi:MAG TPA: hypothetical protein ENG30_03285 [Thermofilaceae archaeon]|nr:hypothetical protein [Thermofilaceae archaeon]